MGWETINRGKVLADKKIQSSQQWAIAFQIHTPPTPPPPPNQVDNLPLKN